MGKHEEKLSLVSSEEIKLFITRVFVSSGMTEELSQICANGMVETSLRGVDTHGIKLLSHYLAGLEGGRINPRPRFNFEKTSYSTGTLDADHALGYGAGMVAMRHAIDLAKESGSGFVSVRNSSHCGALAYFGQEACKENMIGLAYTHATSRMKSPASNREFFGTNPMCFTAPMKSEGPFCFDSAPTPIPFHKVKHYKEDNITLPPGCAADADGNETTDPQKAAQLLPIGDYKGFGWAMMVDILSGLLSGMAVGRDVSKMYGESFSKKRCLGHFFGALKIDAFVPSEIFKDRLQMLAEAVRSEPVKEGFGRNMIPGDPEKEMMKKRISEGIPLSKEEVQDFNNMAGKFELGVVKIYSGR